MNKPERLLYIYTRLLNGKHLKKSTLAQALNINLRSVQRDFSDINNFLYEDEEWRGLNAKIVYDNILETHSLQTFPMKIRQQMLITLLYQIKGTLPVVHEDIYKFIEQYSFSSTNHKILVHNLLRKFHIKEKDYNYSSFIQVARCIDAKYNMTITTQSGTNLYVSPINIHVIDDEFWMTYVKDNLIDAIKFEEIAQLNETSINYTFADMTIKNMITLSISVSFWQYVSTEYNVISSYEKDDKIIAQILMSKVECFALIKKYYKHIKLIAPDSYRNELINQLKTIIDHYL
ncbi:MAG TPA: hypothetical protein K8V85_03750 [Staphylococcus kloosii]|uniref:Uncharacterized protein n=1 Tax=Staphylococcus kloosii TaxID=29384 RepID=A0A921H0S6_9STAP|nr:hypothetical protein [Staphylococcus kloosii]HJF67405.1 hypothetical protein [Staphylococcus kloosii]